MERKTEYIKRYGYVTTGDGLFDTVIGGIKDLVTSEAVGDAGSEVLKAAAKSCGDKLGSKVVERVFKDKLSNKTVNEKLDVQFGYDPVEPIKTTKKTTSRDILKDIYGDGLFMKQKGKGLRGI